MAKSDIESKRNNSPLIIIPKVPENERIYHFIISFASYVLCVATIYTVQLGSPESGLNLVLFFVLFTGVFALITLLQLVKHYFTFDSSKHIYQQTTEWLFFRKKGPEKQFSQVDHLILKVDWGRTGGGQRLYYHVLLVKQSGELERVFVAKRYFTAREKAEFIAELMKCYLKDETVSPPVVRAFDIMHQPFIETLKASARRNRPLASMERRSKIESYPDRLTIEIGPLPFRLLSKLPSAFIPCPIPAFSLVLIVLASLPIIALLITLSPFWLSYLYFRAEKITLTKRSLRISKGVAALSKTVEFPLLELEELFLSFPVSTVRSSLRVAQTPAGGEHTIAPNLLDSFSGSLIARSDCREVLFGLFVSVAELDLILYEMETWIRDSF